MPNENQNMQMNEATKRSKGNIGHLVLLRHGQSIWNAENRFTGWEDIDLSEVGRAEAKSAGELLRASGFQFDRAFTSVLKRAIRTLWIVLDESDRMWIPVVRDWRLNERHYGALTGLDKSETAKKYGDEQVKIWRRSYATAPPLMEVDDSRHPSRDSKYSQISKDLLPSGEALAHCKVRVLMAWESQIAPCLLRGENVLIVAHGNSLRALIQHLEGLSEEQIMGIDIPTAVPLAYELDKQLSVLSKKMLGDAETIQKAIEQVAKQGKSKH